MQEVLGDPIEGEERIVIHGAEEAVDFIKKQLEVSFEVTIWTHGWTHEQIKREAKFLTENKIVGIWDETLNGFLCFKNQEDMDKFYEGIQKELDIEICRLSMEELE